MNTRIFAPAAVVLLATACSFNFERGSDLGPGDVAGTVTLANGDLGSFARVVVDGTGRILRADRDGRFVVKGLAVGTWALRVDFDRDGDGWPEELARRAVQIRLDGDAASFVDLGAVQLAGPAALRGVVEADGVEVTGASVAIVRAVALESEGAPFTADQGVEARVGAGEDGAFFFPAIEEGAGRIRVLLEIDDELYASEDVDVDVGPGENTLADPIVLTLQPANLSRLASLFVAPRGGADERFVVDLLAAGKRPTEAPDFTDALTPDNLTLQDVPLGVFDVHVRSNQGRAGVLHERQVPPAPSTDVIEWGLVHLEVVLCPNDDCDEDGVQGLPPQDGADDPLWADCLAQCREGSDFDIETVAEGRCVSGGETYDCEDDGDGQPDPTEPSCYGVGFGADNDGDGICNPVDAFPFCFANDETCDPEDVTGQYGGPVAPQPPGPDAGPDPEDAGPPDVDAGPGDAGPQGTAPRPPFVAPAFDFPVNAPTILAMSEQDRTTLVFGTVSSGKVQDPVVTDCAVERTQPSTPQHYLARLDADGVCLEIAFGGADSTSGTSRGTRAGDDIVVATFTNAASFTPGVDSAGKPVTETTAGPRIVVARIGPDLAVKDLGVVAVQDDGAQGVSVSVRGIATLGVDEVVVVVETSDASLTFGPGAAAPVSITAGGVDQQVLLRLDGALELAGGVESASDDGFFVEEIISDGAGGLVMSAFSDATTAYGVDVSGFLMPVLFFDSQLAVRFAALPAFPDEQSIAIAAHNGTAHLAITIDLDPVGIYLFGPTAQANRASSQRVAAPDDVAQFGGGSIFNLENLSRWAFDPDRRMFLVGGLAGIQATPASPGFGFTPEVVASATGTSQIELDAANRQLFYSDGAGQLHRCDADDCDNTDAVIASNIFGPFAVDPVGQKIYFRGNGVDRMDYDGANPETFFGGIGPDAIDIDVARGEVFWFDAESTAYFRGDVDTAFSEVDLQVTGPGFPSDLAIDPRDQRLYTIVGTELFSFRRDGTDLQTATIPNLVPLEGVVFADFPPPSITLDGTTVPLATTGISLARVGPNGTLTAEPFAFGTTVFAQDLRVVDGAAYLFGSTLGDVTFEGSTLGVRGDNEADSNSELFVTRLVDDGQRFTPEWVSQSRAPGFTRRGSMDVTADGDVLVTGGVQGGTLGELLAPTDTDFLWHLPPEGELVPPQLRPNLGAVDAFALIGGLATTAPVSLPHGNGGWIGAGPDGSGGFFLQRDDAGGTTFLHEVTNGLPFNIDVSPNGNIGVIIGFSGTFTFGALSHSVAGDDVGVATLIFDANGQLLSSTFAALSVGSDAVDVGVRDDGSFAVLYNVAAAYALEDDQATPVTGTSTNVQAVFGAYDASGRLLDHHVGDATPSSNGAALSVAQDGTAIALVDGAVASVVGNYTLLHVDAAGANDWSVGLEVNGANSILSELDASVSFEGETSAVAVTFDAGVTEVVFRNACFDVTFTANAVDTTLIHTFDRDGCPVDFASLESSSGPMSDTRIQFVDAGGNLVVAGGFSDDVFLDAANEQISATTSGQSIYAAFFSGLTFAVRARSLRVLDGAVSPQLEGFGAYHRGQTWIRAFVGAAGSAVFSEDGVDGTPVNFGADGFIWSLEPENDPTDALLFQGG